MLSDREFQISPIVAESLVHNSKTLYDLQSLSASVCGVAAGILGLESYSGFLFYAACSLVVTLLFYVLRIAPSGGGPRSDRAGSGFLDTSRFFRGQLDVWTGNLLSGLAGYVLTWTLFYGLVRA